MSHKIIFALVLVQVAAAAALGTQFVLSAQSGEILVTDSAKLDRLVAKDCETAVWPDIPERCLLGAESRQPLRTIVLDAAG